MTPTPNQLFLFWIIVIVVSLLIYAYVLYRRRINYTTALRANLARAEEHFKLASAIIASINDEVPQLSVSQRTQIAMVVFDHLCKDKVPQV